MTHKNKEDFNSIITILKDLNKKYPVQGIARHFHDATLEYKNLWGMKDSELLFALSKYKTELDLNIVSEKEVDEILQDGMSLGENLEDYLKDDTDWEENGG